MTLRNVSRFTFAIVCAMGMATSSMAQQPAANSALQTTLSQSEQAGLFTFIVFHRGDNDTTRTFAQQMQEGLAAHAGKVASTTAHVDDPAEQALVTKLGISRAPMPMAVVIAPNGAVTGLFPRQITAEQVAAAIVPPTMMRCMKELQSQKLVFVCLTNSETVDVPQGVQLVQQSPQFKDRISLVGMRLDDPAEARFYQQMKLNPNQVTGPYSVLIAPPGVLIGHFDARSSADQIAAAIHKAGQCCEDENCQHNHTPHATAPTNSPR